MVVLEGVSVRIRIDSVAHDIDGPVTSATSATYTAYHPDGSQFASGVLVYNVTELAWLGAFDAPAVADGLIETVHVLSIIVYNGATGKWHDTVDVQDIPVIGV